MIFVSNWPALPTNGSPCSSSSAPGASPTNINCASMLPTPKTTFFRDAARCGHFMQARARSRRAAIAADLFFEVCFGGIGVASERILAATGVSTGEAAGAAALTGADAEDAVALAAGVEIFTG